MNTLLKSADAAMYAAKEYRGTIRFSSPAINARTMEQLTLETGLRRALDHNEFVLHYQPVVEFGTRKIVSVEALLHWQHPERGLLTPGTFIPLVEGSELIGPIGEWVLRTSCEQLRTWQATGFHELRITVNVAPRQLTETRFSRKLVRILRETGIKPACLALELTERILMRGMERVVPHLQALRNLGIQIDIDDFGAEYSSLNYLRQLPVTGLKIDRSFVHGITTNSEDASIVAMIIDLAHSLKLRVVAEGVETLRQAALLQNRGCTEMQGYYFSPPLPVRTLTTLLATGNGMIATRV
jgi:EAL domain-containing protein (putative c-di-GMP-specific phosphodiesterase class I)